MTTTIATTLAPHAKQIAAATRDAGMSDDPCLWHDARTLHGWETWVDHTVVGEHWPVTIGPMEDRYPDRRVRR